MALFLAFDVVLVGYAVTNDREGPAGAVPQPISSSSRAEPTPTPTQSPSASVAPGAETNAARRATRFISATSDTVAWRAETTACTPGTNQEAVIELSVDGGRIWAPHTVPGIASITRISATNADQMFVIGQRVGTCELTLAVTYSGGAAFADRPADLPSAWYLVPDDSTTLHTASGSSAEPCGPLVELGTSAIDSATVRCADGSLFTTPDGGATWSVRQRVSDVVSLSSRGAVALTHSEGACSLITIATGASFGTSVPCDQTALGDTATSVWVWTGSTVSVQRVS